MRVSAVIPAFNAQSTIARALDSVLAQSRPADQIIVVDDGSRDGTAAVVERYGRQGVTLVRRDNGGPGAARNAGVAMAGGDLIAFLDADDWWAPQKLACQTAAFAKHPSLLVAATGWRWAGDGASNATPPVPLYLRADEWRRPLRARGEAIVRFGFSINSTTVVARREALCRHRFDPSLPTAEDRDVWMNLVAEGGAWFEPAALATVLCRPESQSNANVDRDYQSMLQVLDRHRHRLAPATLRRWQARTYAKWAGRLLAAGQPRQAAARALDRVRRQWWAPTGWWVLGKSLIRSLRP